MCGRFTQKTPADALAQAFDLAESPPDLGARYNIAPTQPVLVVANRRGGRVAEVMRWGLVPAWARDPAVGGLLANARAETLADKPSFRGAFALRRAIILMDGFFEWQTVGRAKVPHYFTLPGGGPFAVAALWEAWQPPDRAAAPLLTTCIVTTAPNAQVGAIHDRMAVILPRTAWEAWLDPAPADRRALASLLAPYAGELDVVRVSPWVNVAGREGPQCIAPASEPAPSRQGSLF